ncbi:glycosyl hydrolase family 71-domain-containing protein [Aspergillus undulatus]|uniref:glycosyl hydrolase family 71-domain-containing protein n=1 Tax=Aspergillus undulatus TaxID=1810928 RepID=UPI003CCE5100
MRLLAALASALACGASLAEAKAVFAHFMVGNTKSLGLNDWRTEIGLAQGAGIDAFVLNIANEDATNDIALPIAFTAAYDMGFQLLFSFDYAGNGAWDKSVVIDMINEYGSKETYFKNDGNPFVSTFEGPNNADDWKDIKKETGCFFMPDWSSVGAQPAVNLGDGIADGLFSWDAWPKGPANMTTYPDASYYDFLGDKPYMMPISPWFYTNLPGYDKNWLWRGDDMWFQRWQQAISLDRQPDFIEIISWNDYGESHYIGPLDDRQYEAFDIGRAPFNYVKDMPHDGWRETLPYYISMYKNGSATVTEERLVAWYRVNKNGACSDGSTTGNTANQLQFEYSPNEMMEDRVFYDVLLTSDAQVTVSIGGIAQAGTWDQEPYGGVGVYHGSVPIGTASGQVVVTVKRGGETIATVTGASITSTCSSGLNNYNPWVGSARGPSIDPVKTKGDLSDLDCVKGFGVYEFIGVCDFACSNGYCPSAACTCLEKGAANPPNETGDAGYPLPGKSGSFAGLCSFDCNHGYCPDTVCGQEPNDGVVLGYSPFLPPSCTGGTGEGAFTGLCDFGCHLGFCPIHACTCTATGILVETPAKTDSKYPTITLDPTVWTAPTAQCPPPCVLVLPPSPLASPTTISFNPWKTSLEFGYTTTEMVDGTKTTHYAATTITTEISIPPVTTDIISFSEVVLTTTIDGGVPSIIIPSPSVSPPPFVITPTTTIVTDDITATPVPRTIRPPPWPWSAAGATGGTYSGTTSTTSGPVAVIPTETGPFPTTVFPTETVSWVRDWVDEPKATQVDDRGGPVPVVPCWAWFVWSCPPDVGGIVLNGFTEPGVYPEGGPPDIGPNPPPGLKLKIPWPQITIGPDLKPTYPENPDPDEDSCETATASVCTTTISYGVVAKRAIAAPTHAHAHAPGDTVEATATTQPRVVIPRDPNSVDAVRTTLQQQMGGAATEMFESRTDQLGTIFFFVPAFTDDQTAAIRGHAQCVFDSSAGEGTYVYDLDYGADPTHPEFSDVFEWMENDEKQHGTSCISKAVGKTVGIARKATVIATVWDFEKGIYEHWLDGLAKVHADLLAGARGSKSGYPNGYPALFGDPSNRNYIPDIIVVGSVMGSGAFSGFANADWVTCYAPGVRLRIATLQNLEDGYRTAGGTSFASATVAGLAAYFRGLDPSLTTAAMVRRKILDFAYRRTARDDGYSDSIYLDRVVWNGQMGGETVAGDCSKKTKRQSSSDDSCPIVNFPPQPSPLTFRTGQAQPTCVADSACGTSCGGGFFCPGTPLKQNPDFLDPRNPDSVQNPDSPYYGDWDGTVSRTTTTTTTTSTKTTTRTATATSTLFPEVPIGGSCDSNSECVGDCDEGDLLGCFNGVCKCYPDQNIPPYGTMCQSLDSCTRVYYCARGDTMVCEERDYSNGNKLCLCIAGSD